MAKCLTVSRDRFAPALVCGPEEPKPMGSLDGRLKVVHADGGKMRDVKCNECHATGPLASETDPPALSSTSGICATE